MELEDKRPFEISDTVSEETSLTYALMTGILPQGTYNFDIRGVPYKINVDDKNNIEVRRI